MPVSDTFLQDMEDENKFIQERHNSEYELRRLRQIEKRYLLLKSMAYKVTEVGNPHGLWNINFFSKDSRSDFDQAIDTVV